MTEYVELHAASAFSFLEGASLPEVLIDRAAEIGMPAMALLDRNGLYGAVRFHTMARKKSVRAHIGAEVAVSGFGCRLRPASWLPQQQRDEPVRLPLLCTSREGYQNLCQLITTMKMGTSTKCEGTAALPEVGAFSRGLVCLTGGEEGPLAAALDRGGETEGRKVVERLVGLFGGEQVYLELQRHGEREEEWRNQCALRIAESLRLPVIATNGVRYATLYEREVMDVFTCIRHGNHTSLQTAGRLLQPNSCRHLRSAKEMVRLFRDLPEAVAHTKELSNRLVFELDDLGYEFPRYPVPEGETMDSYLRKRVREWLRATAAGLRSCDKTQSSKLTRSWRSSPN